jgi:hypothetical protein
VWDAHSKADATTLRWIRQAGRIPIQRSSTYPTPRTFEHEPDEPEPSWTPGLFGPCAELIASTAFRFRDRQR